MPSQRNVPRRLTANVDPESFVVAILTMNLDRRKFVGMIFFSRIVFAHRTSILLSSRRDNYAAKVVVNLNYH